MKTKLQEDDINKKKKDYLTWDRFSEWKISLMLSGITREDVILGPRKKKNNNNNEWFLKKTTRDWPNDGLLRIKKHIQHKQKNEMRKEKQRSTGGLFLKIQGGRD